MERIYLDHSATTPVAPEVLEAMLPYLTETFGNASSIHYFGQRAKSAVDRARHQLAELINSRPNEVYFTSGGTESNNLAIRGFALANESHGRHLITSAIEHPSVIEVFKDLERSGFELSIIPVSEEGLVSVSDVETSLRPDTILVSIMTANNEIGTIQPVKEIAGLISARRAAGQKVAFHTDAVQAVGKIRVDVTEIDCGMLSLSGHKINAPKGVGALYLRRGVRVRTQNVGGRQERGIRAGTEAVPGIVAIGAAADLSLARPDGYGVTIRSLRDRLQDGILERIPDSHVNGDIDRRLPNILNISFDRVEGEALLINLDMKGVAVSTGSACSSGTLEPSPVIRALGYGDARARSAIRFSLGLGTDDESIDRVLAILPDAVADLRRLAE